VGSRLDNILNGILAGRSPQERARDLDPRLPDSDPLPPSVPAKDEYSAEALEQRRAFLRQRGFSIDQLEGTGPEIAAEALRANIESLIGFARIPVGVIGPLRINGVNARGDFYVPMATTEGALVASYQRGARMLPSAAAPRRSVWWNRSPAPPASSSPTWPRRARSWPGSSPECPR
jgi:hydroxymethylglutaryl-CoA reductase (NADPH)